VSRAFQLAPPIRVTAETVMESPNDRGQEDMREVYRLVAESPSDRMETYMTGFYTLVTLIATFGASITFPLIVATEIQPPLDPSDLDLVKGLIAGSWTLFTLSLLLSAAATSFAYGRGFVKAFLESRRFWKRNHHDTIKEVEEVIKQAIERDEDPVSVYKYRIRYLLDSNNGGISKEIVENQTREASRYKQRADEERAHQVEERLLAARLANEMDAGASNPRLLAALKDAEDLHLVAVRRAFMEEMQNARLATFHREVAKAISDNTESGKRQSLRKWTYFKQLTDVIGPGIEYFSVWVVIAPACGAVILLANAVAKYTTLGGIVIVATSVGVGILVVIIQISVQFLLGFGPYVWAINCWRTYKAMKPVKYTVWTRPEA